MAVLGIHFGSQISAQVFLRTGVKNRSRFVPLTQVAAQLAQPVSAALPGLHALTGCDSTSAFVGHGKNKAFSLLSEKGIVTFLAELGVAWEVSEELLRKTERFVCLLYGYPFYASVNQLRYHMFCCKAALTSQLPPTHDALHKHLLCSNFQACIWRRALLGQPDVPSPHGHGWKVREEGIEIDWISQQPAPAELLKLVSCSCHTGCTSRQCSCFKANMHRYLQVQQL